MSREELHGSLREFLRASSWTQGLTDAQLDRVCSDARVSVFPAGTTVCASGSSANRWLGVVQGMLKVETVALEGKTATFAGVPAGAWLGEGAVMKGEPLPYDVVAIRDSVVAMVPRTTFMWLLAESHPFALWLVQQLNTRLGYYVALVQSFRLNDTTAQVAYCLAELFNQDLYPTPRTRLSISQEDIGRLSGLSRQVANRELRTLHQGGVIRMGYGTIEVLDLAALQRIARGS